MKTVNYKSLDIIVHEDLHTLEYRADDNKLSGVEDYIDSLAILTEYCGFMKPDYLIIDKTHSAFKLDPQLFDYTKQMIFEPLKSYGVKKLFMIVKPELYEHAYKRLDKTSFIIGSADKQDIFEKIISGYFTNTN